MAVRIVIGDMVERLRELPDNSVDSCVCDPPYHLVSIVRRFGSVDSKPALSAAERRFAKTGGADRKPGTDQYGRLSKGFMGQTWDGGDVAFRPETWAEVWRVLKPGGHLAAFSGTRTYHRMACAIEDAGFEIRDQLAWAYGSGFPKSHDISKAIDRAAGAEREVVGTKLGRPGMAKDGSNQRRFDAAFAGIANGSLLSSDITAPATDDAREWEGWGTALKPAWEPICLARKPLSEKSVAANVLKWGTGALNIDGCRIEAEGVDLGRNNNARTGGTSYVVQREAQRIDNSNGLGRWPANLCHDGSDEVVAGFPDSEAGQPRGDRGTGGIWNNGNGVPCGPQHGDSGSAARYFYCAKASKLDRLGSDHPTVKPVELMRWLVRLVTPPKGLVLDPFAGSGSTGIAAFVEGFDAHLVELREEAAADAQRRIDFIQGLGQIKALEMARLDDNKRKAAGGHGLPLFAAE